MKRSQRINRVTRKAPPRRRRFFPILLVLAAGAVLIQLTFVGALVTAAGAGAVSYYDQVSKAGLKRLKHAPVLHDVKPTVILDRKGRVLWQISDTTHGLHTFVPVNKIPRSMKNAIVAAEDKTFYSNLGFEPTAVLRALRDNLLHHSGEGASTITQQTVKNLLFKQVSQYGTSQENVQRKIQEIVIAYAMSQKGSGFTKDQILSLYLNNVFFGHNAYGIEAAAQMFFGRHIWQLDIAQCALLAGIVKAPSDYEPLGPYGPTRAMTRARTYVLPRMRDLGFISATQLRMAQAEVDTFRFSEPLLHYSRTPSVAPYWTDWIEHLLTYGSANDENAGWYTDPELAAIVARAGGFTAGLTIRTTLDLDMYNQAQQIMRDKVALIAYNNVKDAAVVTIDPQSAECLAMVGGLDYYSKATGSLINMAAHPREPGSSFKVFTYLTAFKDLGWSPAHMLVDESRTWPDGPNQVYKPENYDLSYHGALSVRMALANSYNIPAVETIDAVGPMAALKTAVAMGVWHLRGLKYAPLSLTLGSKEVPLWQMAQAYNTIANGGVFRPMASILSIQDAQGATIYTYHRPRGVQVLAPQYAYLITSILKDNYARVPGFLAGSVLQLGPDNLLPVNRPAAVKTGTSQYFRDNLTIGFTPNLLVATWVGNPDGSRMKNIEGVDGAGPIWHDLMEWAITQHLNLPWVDFKIPSGVSLERVSSATSSSAPNGYLASPYSAWSFTDYFAAGTVPHQYDPAPGYRPADYDSHAGQRFLGTIDFSVDGGTSGGIPAGGAPAATTIPPTPIPGAQPTPYPGSTTGGGTPSGSGGTLPYNPGSHANLCARGGYYRYYAVYQNGQVVYHYTCL